MPLEDLNFDLIISKGEIPSGIINYGYVTLGNYLKLSNLNWRISYHPKLPVAVLTDSYFDQTNFDKINEAAIKIAIILEPYELISHKLKWLESNYKKFDFILTYEDFLLKTDSRFVKYIVGGSFLRPTDKIVLSPKDKLMSMVFSEKNYLPGHNLRHQIYKEFKESKIIDFFGKSSIPFDYQGTPYSRYKYSIVIENVFKENYFTEKLIDCLLFRTIPIYFGDPEIGKYFNPQGIIKLRNLSNLNEIIKDIRDDKFFIPNSVILENQYKAAQFLSKEYNIEKTIRICLNLPKVNDFIDSNTMRNILDGKFNLDPGVVPKHRFLPSAFIHFLYRYFYIFSSKLTHVLRILKIKARS
jgi:hypothetical protein